MVSMAAGCPSGTAAAHPTKQVPLSLPLLVALKLSILFQQPKVILPSGRFLAAPSAPHPPHAYIFWDIQGSFTGHPPPLDHRRASHRNEVPTCHSAVSLNYFFLFFLISKNASLYFVYYLIFFFFNAILPNLPTLSLCNRVHKTVLYISVSFAVSYPGLLLASF